ncbi:DUF4402 domain-containing protein [Christiangramia portivictoriae]|uniref:DUF4402 domain-containing protein n=1 Tax=Christiangramia portivictoriae TaxID=326069 RepID=UPI0004242965|nr:DUF4402 domain-containing protein [Christiangramia portivictoriae]
MQYRYFIIMIVFMIALFPKQLKAQENPPIPINVEVNTAQFLNFGSFAVDNGVGTVTVDSDGTRTWTGDVKLLNTGTTVSPALFDVYANPGTLVNIMHDSQFTLNGTSGQTLTLEINSYSTGKTFITTAASEIPNPVYVGGTLNIGPLSANGAGNYSGFFTLTFIQE